MKTMVGLFVFMSLSLSIWPVGAQDLVDFGSCNLKIIQADEIESFKGENGNLIKPSRRDTRLVEVTIEINPTSTGAFGLYPAMFSALFTYRGVIQVTPAVALGTKIVDRMSGDKREYWYNEPDVSIILEVKAGERFIKYVVLEVPKETDALMLQGPTFVGPVGLDQVK